MDFSFSENTVNIRGTVENVVYHSEDTGYCVFDIEDEKGELVTAVGTVPFISVGEQVELYGKWAHHKVYGRQFRVERFEKILPTDKNEILRYLSSGAIKGIGPKTKEILLKEFKTINGIKEASKEKLTETLGAAKAEIIWKYFHKG